MTLGMTLFIVFDVLFLAAYCWFYKPKSFYGGYPAELWQEPERRQGAEKEAEVTA